MKTPAKDPLLKWRKEFPILSRCTYLISNSLGAMPKRVYGRLDEFADLWASQGVLAWDRWLPMVQEIGDGVGKIFGAPKGTVTMHQNVSTLIGVVASCLDYPAGKNEVVYEELNFPSVHYVWKEHERIGAKVVLVPSDDGIGVPTQRMVDAITDRTLIVSISHVLFRSGFIQDLKPIIEAAHRKGAYVLVDAYQSTGSVPVDVKALGVDFFVGGSVKWLCGGPGACYLYVREDLIPKLRPRMAGWLAHQEPFAFEMAPIRYPDDARRFMGGSPAVPALYSARSGHEIVAKVGVNAIRKKSMRLTALIVEKALEQGLTVNTPLDPAVRGGHVVVDCPDSEAIHHELIRRKFLVDWRPNGGIRFSPHFYNTEDECSAGLDEIAKIRKKKGRAIAR